MMRLLSGTISICTAVWIHMYLYGLEAGRWSAYNVNFYFYYWILMIFGVTCIFQSFKIKSPKKNSDPEE